MMPDVDYQKLLTQEPEFRDFAKQIVFEIFNTANPDADQTMAMLYNFYQLGTDTADVVKFIRNMSGGPK